MTKSKRSLRTIIRIGVVIFAFLLLISLVNYASLSQLILTLLKDLKAGH